MKMKIVFHLMFASLFVIHGNLFAMEEATNIEPTEGYDNTVHPQGTELKYNTYYGKLAGLHSSSDKYYNSFFGSRAGTYNTGSSNSILGYIAGYNNEGSSNCIIGSGAGKENEGSYNVFLGNNTGEYCEANYNCLVGYNVGRDLFSGAHNTIIGAEAGKSLNGGDYNTIIGRLAGSENDIGDYNIFLGYGSGGGNESGSNNICIGNLSGFHLKDESNRLYIGGIAPLIYGELDNQVLHINGDFKATTTSVASDRRLKKNIRPLHSPLKHISELNGVTFEWRTEEYQGRGLKKGKQIGLVAQDVEKTIPELVSEDEYGFKGVSYSKLTAILVEAVKELKVQNQKQEIEIERLRALVEDMKSRGM